jgi:hypothetical protein
MQVRWWRFVFVATGFAACRKAQSDLKEMV